MAFGKKSSFATGGNFKKRNTWSIKPGNNIIRILPQMHSLAEDENGWHIYERMHWGYAGVDTKDPSKTRGKPFRCIKEEDRRNGLVLQECPECVLVDGRKEEAKELEAKLTAEGKAKGLSETKPDPKTFSPLEEYIEAGMTSLKLWLKAHNLDAKVYLAVKKDGEFGQFKVTYTMFKAIRAKFQEIESSEGINALALDQGLEINVIRKGDGFVERDTFEIVMEDVVVNGKKYKQYKQAPISEEEAERALADIEDLSKAGGLRITYDQIKALVESSGDPEEVDAILAINKTEAVAAKQAIDAQAGHGTYTAAAEAPKAAPVAVTKPVNDNATAPPQPLDPAIQARLDAIQAKKAAAEAKAKEEAAAKVAEVPTVSLLDMSDEDFLASVQGSAK